MEPSRNKGKKTEQESHKGDISMDSKPIKDNSVTAHSSE